MVKLLTDIILTSNFDPARSVTPQAFLILSIVNNAEPTPRNPGIVCGSDTTVSGFCAVSTFRVTVAFPSTGNPELVKLKPEVSSLIAVGVEYGEDGEFYELCRK